jgi:hypothetical protein
MGVVSKWARTMVPLGEHGFTKMSQIQLRHVYGPVAPLMVFGIATFAFYVWYKVAIYTAKKIYSCVVLGERAWLLEMDRNNAWGEYYFKDTPMASDEDFPDLARAVMGQKPRIKGEWVK